VRPVGSYCTDMSRCTVNKTLNLSKTVQALVPVHTIVYARSSPFGEAILDTTITLCRAYNCGCTVIFLFVVIFRYCVWQEVTQFRVSV